METNSKKYKCKNCGKMVSMLYQFDFCKDCIMKRFEIIKDKLHRSRVFR